MKTIKIIDLLNMISKGEEVPKHVRYYNMIENIDDIMYVCKENIFCKLDTLQIHLNSRVEIIEEPQEHKIPEKLEICYSPDIEEEIINEKGNKPNHYVLGDAGNKLIIGKINEILDYLEVNND